MRPRSCPQITIAVAGMLLSSTVCAAPIDFTTGINTGVSLSAASLTIEDGMQINLPITTFIQSKTYTAQIVPTGSIDDISQAYRQFTLDKALGFGSALADGKGRLETGLRTTCLPVV